MKTSVKFLLLFTICVCTTTAMFAQEEDVKPTKKAAPEKKVARLDRNEDGLISMEEAAQAKNEKLSEKFHEIDLNKDGFIDKEELTKFHAKRRSQDDF